MPKFQTTDQPTRLPQPIILIRGFGGLGIEDEKKIAYQGFNDGTVYPQKRGENYIYEGLTLRFLKSRRWQYADATNIVGYYDQLQAISAPIPPELSGFDPQFFIGSKVVIDPGMALNLLESPVDPLRMLWIFRYYDLNDRTFGAYGSMLARLIDFIQHLAVAKSGRNDEPAPKVNIIAHSMGGLIVREAVQRTYPAAERKAADHINKIVTLGTPHKGISFQVFSNWLPIGAEKELEHFHPEFQDDGTNPAGYKSFGKHFPSQRLLTVVGTNYRTYGPVIASWLNRVFSVGGEFGANYNRSDGLVKQFNAEVPGAPRTFVHKCHGGPDSLVTSREAYEVATRFFFGNVRARLKLVDAKITRGFDIFGKSEFFFGVSIKPRGVDFDLFHQSAEAENCYGPFNSADLSDAAPAFGWANGEKGLVWEGWLDTGATQALSDTGRAPSRGLASPGDDRPDVVMRLDFYVGERDVFGVGFSDNVVFRKQYYARAVLGDIHNLATLSHLELHDREKFDQPTLMRPTGQPNEWTFEIGSEQVGFRAKLQLEFSVVPEVGEP